MKIAFYKNGRTLFDKLICAVTKGKYSHCELIFDQLFPANNFWFTSSPRDGGVRFKHIIPTTSHWDYIDLNITLKQEQRIFDWANHYIGIKYNWIGVVRFIIPFLPSGRERLFCSQICIILLQYIGLFKDLNADNISPQNFYNYLIDRGYATISN